MEQPINQVENFQKYLDRDFDMVAKEITAEYPGAHLVKIHAERYGRIVSRKREHLDRYLVVVDDVDTVLKVCYA